MANGKDTARSRIENIKTNIGSTTTCTPATVAELESILVGKATETIQKENVKTKGSQLRSVQSVGRKKTVGASAATVSLEKQTSAAIAPREKYILATEVANLSLKSLSDALKTQPTRLSKPKPTPEADGTKPVKTRRAHSRSPSYAQKPLQERSTSQAINTPTKPSSLRRSLSYSSCMTSGPDPGLVATAECARVAFAYLRTPEAIKIAGKDAPALQLENGILALVGKLVAHGLDNIAMKELRVLKRRLDQLLGITRAESVGWPTKTKAEPNTTSVPTEKESLAALLDFGDVDRKSPALPLVVTYQSYTLRLIGRIRRPRLVEEAWNCLKLSNPSSPAHLQRHLAKASSADPKSIRQLESLAQAVLSLCPSTSSSEDVSADQECLQTPPDVAFSLQHLAFKIRQWWWALAKHQGNEEKELLEPFSRCLATFARRSKLSAVKKYKIAVLLYTDLLGRGDNPGSSRREHSDGVSLASKHLSSLAQSAGLTDEALRWLDTHESPDSSEESATKVSIRLVRRATLSFAALLKGTVASDLETPISQALASFTASLDGSSPELDSLFMEVNSFRRMAYKALSESLQGGPREYRPSQLQHQALRIIYASVHFCARYLGSMKAIDSDPKYQAGYSQRVTTVAKCVKNLVDSVCLCSKLNVESDPESHWIDLDALLQDSFAILQHFTEQTTRSFQSPEELHHPFVKLSNAYWAVHLQLKVANGITNPSIQAMQRSVDILRLRPLMERQSGLLPMKLERLGEALDSTNRGHESREVYSSCIRNLIDTGIVSKATELAAKLPISQIFESNRPESALGRVVKSYQRTFIKNGLRDDVELAFFDDVKLPVASRGLLLEWQLSLYAKALTKNRSWDPKLNRSIQAIPRLLLNLYTVDHFPIRLLRTRIMHLQLSLAHPDILSPSLIQFSAEAIEDIVYAETEDQGLVNYASHLNAQFKFKTAVQESPPSIDAVHDCLSTWQSLLESAASWEELSSRIDNTELWLADLQAATDYLAAKGEEYTCLPVLHLLVKAQELQNNVNLSQLIIDLCTMGTQLLRLGYSGKAGLVFAKARPLTLRSTTSTEANLQFHLGYAEYLLEIGNVTKCEDVLSTAETIAQGDKVFMGLSKPSATLSGRIRFNRILSDACYVYSLLSIKNGYNKDAARYAKQCVALNRRIWAALESKCSSKKSNQVENSETEGEGFRKGYFDPLSSMRNEKGLPLVMSITHDSLEGPEFWSLVPRLYRGLMQQSLVFAHQGLLQEAVYVAEQADKVASATDSRSLIVDNAGRRAEYWAQSGRTDKAQTTLRSIDRSIPYAHLFMTTYFSAVARIYHKDRRFDEEVEAYDSLEGLLRELTLPSFINKMDVPRSVEDLTEILSTIALSESTTKGKKPTRATRGRKPISKAASKPSSRITARARPKDNEAVPVPSETAADECLLIHRLQADVTRRKALVYLVQESFSTALDLLGQAQNLEKSLERNSLHLWVSFKAMLSQSMRELASDFTFNSLPESTIALPAMGLKDRRSSEGLVKRAQSSAAIVVKGAKGKKSTKEDFVSTLHQARERLIESHQLCTQASSSYTFRQASSALSHLTLLLSAVSNGDVRGTLHPLYAAYMGEIPKSYSLLLAKESIEIEQESMSRDECLKWPELKARKKAMLVNLQEFQQEYIDIIPRTWTAISLALNEDCDELYVTRYESGFSPFVLRLPMCRHSSRDVAEEEFSFKDGQRDFEEIIELSDFSTRSAKDMTSKEARLQWWAEREALDTRLQELLLNIENIWLGGFKGIFSQHSRQANLLARFRKTFENILDRHLPSRRGKAPPRKPTLDTRVLELFVGLGDATNDELDLDEALMDLIYFVVDILQFNGERNAYDEIDFDAMVIETLDALRAYHSASQDVNANSSHTILILDKDLHMFPWESLPSLQSLSISRLPSLAALRERILASRSSDALKDAQPGHYLNAMAGGTSMLNPSGDLTHTLKTLKPHLDEMQGSWTHIVNRAPSEKEFESALKEQELVLYFGHGSGAQFVRAKAVRRLCLGSESGYEKPGCAATFLFGCSSVHLSDNGIYEPSGMLASYLTAGAPAVVGMLWDVTDKDCDRFAVKAGEVWGLWPELKEDVEAPKTKKKPKGKGKVAQLVAEVESVRGVRGGKRSKKEHGRTDDGGEQILGVDKQRRRGVGLDEAVREARDACVLRYLNGAAAVVYGIPVYLV